MPGERRMFEMTRPALEALAHPVRARLMSALRTDGPATATALAARVGESSGLTSYHLRKLAAVGLIEEDPDRGTKKERWWKPVHEGTIWNDADFHGDPEAHRASQAFRRNYYAWQARLLEHRLEDEANWTEDWVRAASDSDDGLTLTPAQASAMSQEIWEVVQRYRAEGDADAPDAARVIWLHHVVPIFGDVTL